MPITTPEQADLFLSVFRGRQDVYARYWEKGDRSGYSPAYEFDWAEFHAFKDKGGTLKDFPIKQRHRVYKKLLKMGKRLLG